MFSLRCSLAGLLFAACCCFTVSAQPSPGATNALQFQYSIIPTNGAFLITETTNTISITVSNYLAFTNIVITGRTGTNVIRFNDAGTPPDNAADDGIFRGRLVAPPVTERTPLTLSLLLTGLDLASITNEPPAEFPIGVTNAFDVLYTIVPRPPNDNFTNAFKLLSAGGVTVGTNEFASPEPREPRHANLTGASQSVWWTWASPANSRVLVDLAGSTFPGVLAVYQGDRLSNLVAVASSTNDTANRLPPNVSFDATRGTTYRIAVSGIDTNATGIVRLRVAPGGTPDTRPPVVTIQSPTQDSLVSSAVIAVSGSAREPFPLDSGISNIVLQVNGGPPTNAIGTELWSAILTLPPGTNVIRAVAVDFAGNRSAADSVVVRYLNPTNDYFSLSRQLEGIGGFVSSANDHASREAGEPLHAGNDGGRSVWYWWRAPTDGQLALTTSGSLVDTLLAVYAGDALDTLTEILSNDDVFPGSGWSEISLAVTSNSVYRVAVDAYGAAVGEYSLQYIFTPREAGTFYNLTINPANGGAVSPPGGAFPVNGRVTVTAVPLEDFAFVGWEGDIVSGENPLTLTITRNQRITPRFQTVRFTEDFESGDFSRLPWVLSAPRWLFQTNEPPRAGFSARTPALGGRQSASLALSTNTGPGLVSFDVRVSTEPAWDVLEFLIDGTVVRRWSGEHPWQTVTFNLGGGPHTFTWRYSKDPNFEAGLDAVFLDNIYLPPPRAIGGSFRPTLSIRLFSEGPQLTLQGEPGVVYEIQSAPSPAGPWFSLLTQSSPSGVINALDVHAVGAAQMYYRARVK